MKIGYQLKQVRERLAKGLVDKGILRTEKRNFLLFDMATHPVVDSGAKEEIRRRVRNVLTQRTVVLNGTQWLPENLEFRYLRTVSMVCAAYAANVLENALSTLGHEAREKAFNQTDELLADYSQWPFGRKATSNDIGENLPQVIAEVRPPYPPFPPLLSIPPTDALRRKSTKARTRNSNSRSSPRVSTSSPASTPSSSGKVVAGRRRRLRPAPTPAVPPRPICPRRRRRRQNINRRSKYTRLCPSFLDNHNLPVDHLAPKIDLFRSRYRITPNAYLVPHTPPLAGWNRHDIFGFCRGEGAGEWGTGMLTAAVGFWGRQADEGCSGMGYLAEVAGGFCVWVLSYPVVVVEVQVGGYGGGLRGRFARGGRGLQSVSGLRDILMLEAAAAAVGLTNST